MRIPPLRPPAVLFLVFGYLTPVVAADPPADVLRPMDVFQLEYASDPQISPDGTKVVYVRNFMDVMKDRRRSNLWVVNTDGGEHRPLTTGKNNDHSPRWSPDGKRLVYVSNCRRLAAALCRWMDDGQAAKLTDLTSAPGNPSWSPDGKWIAFTTHVPTKPRRPLSDAGETGRSGVVRGAEGDPLGQLPGRRRRLLERGASTHLRDRRRRRGDPTAHRRAVRAFVSACLDAGREVPDLFREPAYRCGTRPAEHGDLRAERRRRARSRRLPTARGRTRNRRSLRTASRSRIVGFDDQRKGYQQHRLYVMNRDGTDGTG